VVDSLRASTPTLLLDNGDVNQGYGRQSELKYETAMKAMAAMGYAAMNVGERDLQLGIDYLRYVSDFANVPLLSANIVDAEGMPVFQPHVLRTMGGGDTEVTAAVIGVISTSFKEQVELSNPGLTVQDYGPTVEQIIGSLQGKANVLILLAHMNEQEASGLAERFKAINFIIVSHSGDDPFTKPFIQEDAPIGFSGAEGKNLGVARFELRNRRVRLSEYSTIKLDAALEDSPAMTAILQDYRHMVRAEKLVESVPTVEHDKGPFTGNAACSECHGDSALLFAGDKHAHAFDSLAAKGDDYDPECVRCHTVGFGYVTGFVSHESTPELEHVGCENCHGPGSTHARNPLEEGYGHVSEETCTACHDLANSPNFVYEEYLQKLTPHAGSALSG
jgi:2',3'-cyclic-nucleotide 2'-phosphodiesterase (5'-nucleotidase family)